MKQSTFKLRQGTQKPNKKRLFILLGVASVLIAMAAFAGYRYTQRNQVDQNATDPTLVSEKSRDSSDTDQSEDKRDQAASTITAQEVPNSQNITLSGASFSQADGVVTSSVIVTGASGAGKCVFTFSATDSRAVVKEVGSVQQGTQQKCAVSIGEQEFDKVGDWGLSITFFQNNQKASTNLGVTVN